MPDFSRRSGEAELMDDPSVDLETFRGCLADLAKVNAVTLARVPTLDFLGRLRRAGRLDLGRPVEILDVGSGYGDTLDGIAAWSKRGGAAVRLTGIDLNPWAAQIAQAAHPGMPRFITGDVFAHEGAADIVVSSLFTHHLDDDQIVRFLRWMEAHAAVGWFVNDLHRHAFAYYGFGLLARLMGWHRFVRHDGPISIARAFTPADWQALIARAGLDVSTVRVRRRFPFRVCVERIRP
jgi:SAM-dependent methyltransferase